MENIERYEIRDADGKSYQIPTEFILAAARKISRRSLLRMGEIKSPIETKEFLKGHIGSLSHEVFIAILLDTKHRVIEIETLSRGTLNAASVSPREVLKSVLRHNAATVIFAHNHPSGDIEPSQDDRRVTKKLTETLALIDVRVLDHIIVSTESAMSFAESNFL